MIHSGDTIYADNPVTDEVRLRDGGVWKNRVVTEAKRDIAQTLDQFRGQWTYNLLDEHVKAFNAVCPVFYQWDDHEVLNNWSPSTDLRDDDRYKEKSIATLAARASRASTARCLTVRCSMSSSSTCAPIAARIAMGSMSSRRRSRGFWASARWRG
jgi:phosphodiesterase/alkaline phosphatase D-like protein